MRSLPSPVKPLYDIMTHGEFTKHVALTSSSPLLSPMTELILVYLPSDISPDKKTVTATQLQQFVYNGIGESFDVESVSYGWGVENDFPVKGGDAEQKGSILMALIGWSGVDAHKKFRETEASRDVLDSIGGMEGMVKLATLCVRCRSLESKVE
ncbi:hypothetical protein P153DRAFT_391896 [Dothidotthia symphoricarpi CBS 119687]|uniref:Uncharacterized protein n=1 Tax=Dothidotthia symphoricarpi CBS 119687 TaxID=1392245 RepID=A0A6A6ARF2_9PLEO|nr:uncharacterized protein P153DRAFT_391896 [Dothidotthia symphoricarpi CBS 119687]KAF2134562.1 hypothetical protein P153DRAFT_391896 [Dothidotthia symphoricarpi CBS 119687]